MGGRGGSNTARNTYGSRVMWTAVWEAEQTDGEDETYGMDIETY